MPPRPSQGNTVGNLVPPIVLASFKLGTLSGTNTLATAVGEEEEEEEDDD